VDNLLPPARRRDASFPVGDGDFRDICPPMGSSPLSGHVTASPKNNFIHFLNGRLFLDPMIQFNSSLKKLNYLTFKRR
jgi:hypothetical protein